MIHRHLKRGALLSMNIRIQLKITLARLLITLPRRMQRVTRTEGQNARHLMRHRLAQHTKRRILPTRCINSSRNSIIRQISRNMRELAINTSSSRIQRVFITRIRLSTRRIIPIPVIVERARTSRQLPTLVTMPDRLFFNR